jgi:hypothetical protein
LCATRSTALRAELAYVSRCSDGRAVVSVVSILQRGCSLARERSLTERSHNTHSYTCTSTSTHEHIHTHAQTQTHMHTRIRVSHAHTSLTRFRFVHFLSALIPCAFPVCPPLSSSRATNLFMHTTDGENSVALLLLQADRVSGHGLYSLRERTCVSVRVRERASVSG